MLRKASRTPGGWRKLPRELVLVHTAQAKLTRRSCSRETLWVHQNSSSSRARAQLMPLRWEQHLLPVNRTSGPRLQTVLRQFINPDVPMVPSSAEQEMMELWGISLLNAACRKSQLQTQWCCCWWPRGKTSQLFSLFHTGLKHQNASVWGKIWKEQALGRGFISISLSHIYWKTKSFP